MTYQYQVKKAHQKENHLGKYDCCAQYGDKHHVRFNTINLESKECENEIYNVLPGDTLNDQETIIYNLQ